MRRDGPLRVRIEEVSRIAGCSRATLYRHVADKDELVREVLVRMSRARAGRMHKDLVRIKDPAERIAEGVQRTVEAVRGEWWFQALDDHSAVARIGGGPQAFVALTTPLVAPFLEEVAAAGMLRPGVTTEDATEWLCVVTTGLLAVDVPTTRTRDEQVAYLRRFVADPLLHRR